MRRGRRQQCYRRDLQAGCGGGGWARYKRRLAICDLYVAIRCLSEAGEAQMSVHLWLNFATAESQKTSAASGPMGGPK